MYMVVMNGVFVKEKKRTKTSKFQIYLTLLT